VIHPTALVDPNAKIAEGVEIGPFSVIGPEVEIGEGTWVGPHVVINGATKIGRFNKIFQFASVGEASQDRKYAGEKTFTVIGDRNVIREGVTIHRGTTQDKGITQIGNDNLFMAYVHIAHDCVIGNYNTFANNAGIAGHVKIGDFVGISGFCGIHQFSMIGSYSFISHASIIIKDVPPYVLVVGGANATTCGINAEGLKRRGFTSDAITGLKRAYKLIYRQGLRVPDAVLQLREMEKECPEIKPLADFLEMSERGIIR
jgi:UDP-N-acetylglucosamine acyltransferase